MNEDQQDNPTPAVARDGTAGTPATLADEADVKRENRPVLRDAPGRVLPGSPRGPGSPQNRFNAQFLAAIRRRGEAEPEKDVVARAVALTDRWYELGLAGDLEAGKAWMDRIYGKPVTGELVDGGDGVTLIRVSAGGPLSALLALKTGPAPQPASEPSEGTE